MSSILSFILLLLNNIFYLPWIMLFIIIKEFYLMLLLFLGFMASDHLVLAEGFSNEGFYHK